jgi:hypothetical protein
MEFGRVHGKAIEDTSCPEGHLRIVVVLETRSQVRTVREECVPLLHGSEGMETIPWHADQYTQETIGIDLALEGWEAISPAEAELDRGTVDRATVTYVVRRL